MPRKLHYSATIYKYVSNYFKLVAAKLARAQEWVLHNVLEKLATEAPAHGFVKGRSTSSCAYPHVGRTWWSTSTSRTSSPPSLRPGAGRLSQRLGYSPAVATDLGRHLHRIAGSPHSSPRAPQLCRGRPARPPPGRLHQPRALQPDGERSSIARLLGMASSTDTPTPAMPTIPPSPAARGPSETRMLLARVATSSRKRGSRSTRRRGAIERAGQAGRR